MKVSLVSLMPFVSSRIHAGIMPLPDHFTDLSLLVPPAAGTKFPIHNGDTRMLSLERGAPAARGRARALGMDRL
jgi:hypothetical protein